MASDPYFRESGSGPTVVCLHSNASSSGQWLPLMENFGPRYRVLAPDFYGSGRSPAWRFQRHLTLRDELALIEPVLARARGPVTLVGHSYGAAVALIAALEHPERVHALALYEPTLFSLVDMESPVSNDVAGFRAALAEAVERYRLGDAAGAARCFVDYWSGTGAWDRMSEARQGQVAATMTNIRGWAHACLTEPTPLSAFAWLGAPVLLMTGSESPASSRAVARLLARALPRVHAVELEGMGHMGPVTHPKIFNGVVSQFLERHRPFHHADLFGLSRKPQGAASAAG